jgi:hypothetical protein
MLLVLFEAITLYSGVYMCIKSFYRKLSDRVKHSIIFIVLICPTYLIANVLAVRFNSIMIGLMIWSLYFCINGYPTLCVLCVTLGINLEPKALIFILPMMIYTMKIHVLNTRDLVMNVGNQINSLILKVYDQSSSLMGAYIIFFLISGFIWAPWLLNEELTALVRVVTKCYLPSVKGSLLRTS